MKLAIVGNMNNNGFAIMRYFRDLGVDAHLFLYSNDGVGPVAHFQPSCDSWDHQRWVQYIHQMPVADNIISGVTYLMGLPLFAILKMRSLFNGTTTAFAPVPLSRIRAQLAGFDYYIGSGIAPAVFSRCGMTLDIYYPYAAGSEFLGDPETTRKNEVAGYFSKKIRESAMQKQRQGVLNSRWAITAELGLTKQVLKNIGKETISLYAPIVYAEEAPPAIKYSGALKDVLEQLQLRSNACVFLSPVRHFWINTHGYPAEQWCEVTKNNDWLIRAFARVLVNRPDQEVLLLLTEYGQDVEESKALCAEIGIADRVLWIPKMSRKELFVLMQYVDAVAGQFTNAEEGMWGGVGWEALLMGCPLIQSFRFAEGRYEACYGHPRPPVLPVESPEDVYVHLLHLVDTPEQRRALGVQSERWFSEHQGRALATKWLELLCSHSEQSETCEL